MFKLNLGIIYRGEQPIKHRNLIKVLFNPILRYFGFQLATLLTNDNKIGDIILTRCNKVRPIVWSWKYDIGDGEYIIKKRMLI